RRSPSGVVCPLVRESRERVDIRGPSKRATLQSPATTADEVASEPAGRGRAEPSRRHLGTIGLAVSVHDTSARPPRAPSPRARAPPSLGERRVYRALQLRTTLRAPHLRGPPHRNLMSATAKLFDDVVVEFLRPEDGLAGCGPSLPALCRDLAKPRQVVDRELGECRDERTRHGAIGLLDEFVGELGDNVAPHEPPERCALATETVDRPTNELDQLK